MENLDHSTSKAAADGTSVCLRAQTPLEPLGGTGDVSSLAVAIRTVAKYAVGQRRIDGE
jgi:hypothetical protein